MLLLPLMMFSGLYNKLNSIPDYVSWIQYISPFKYGLHMILESQYEDLKITFVDGSIYDYKAELGITSSF
jgi:ABC-type multidrug transport system permease subunit